MFIYQIESNKEQIFTISYFYLFKCAKSAIFNWKAVRQYGWAVLSPYYTQLKIRLHYYPNNCIRPKGYQNQTVLSTSCGKFIFYVNKRQTFRWEVIAKCFECFISGKWQLLMAVSFSSCVNELINTRKSQNVF